MAQYNYTREIVDNYYNINNPYCLDGGGKRVFLYIEIKDEATLPNSFHIDCNGSAVGITFPSSLDSSQQTTLTAIVNAHKAHTAG